MDQKKLEDVLRVIELCKSVESSSANPFDVDIREKIALLKSRLPEWEFLDDLLLDSEAMLELTQIIKLQDEWLKHRASSLYIDPLLIQLKVRLLSKEELIEAFVKSWHPLAQLDQLSPRGLERAFVYWRDLEPMSERFKQEFGNYGVKPGILEFQDLVDLKVFTEEQFDHTVDELYQQLLNKSDGEWIDYREFIRDPAFEKKVIRAYLLAFIISEGRASLKVDPLTGTVWIAALGKKLGGTPKSVAISVTGEN
jgi:hypothetical protein